MKNLLLISMVLLLSILNLEGRAQDKNWNFESLTFSAGETPLTKGLTLSPVFSKGNSILVVDLNPELGEIMWFHKINKNFSIGPSVGFFKNTPWVGPIAEIKFFKGHFKTLNWFGWSFGEAEKSTTEAEVNFMFSYHQFSLVWGGVECYYTLQHYYCALPEHIVGTKISSKLGKNFSIFGGVGYMARAEKFLWSTGIIFINQK